MSPRTLAASFRPRHRRALLYLTHFWDDACARELAGLQRSLSGTHDIVVAGALDAAPKFPLPDDIPHFLYTAKDLRRLRYPHLPEMRPHHLIALRFFQDYPDYEQIWMIEYDVRYTGDWAELFQELDASEADLLATIVQRILENPDWYWWGSLRVGDASRPEPARIKAFLPLVRLSNRALRTLDGACKSGWSGHFEVLWPTVITAAGFLVEEIGGQGEFTPPHRYGRYYSSTRLNKYLSPGSFVFRPSFLESDIGAGPPLLWRPVKSPRMSQPLPPPPAPPRPPGWRDLPALQPLRRVRQRLRHGSTPRQN